MAWRACAPGWARPARALARRKPYSGSPGGHRMRRFMAVMLMLTSVAAARPRATVVVAADLGELARDARAIPRGRVVAVEGRWTDDRRTIETLVTLEVDGYLKGSLGATLQFRVPGGELGRYRRIVVGAPEFSVGQHV